MMPGWSFAPKVRNVWLAVFTAILLLLGSGQIRAEVTVFDGKILVTSSKARSAAAFLKIKNYSSSQDVLLELRADFARMVEIHQTEITSDGVMRMNKVEQGLVIPANETLELDQNGAHVMFMNLIEAPAVGSHVEVELVFEKTGALTVFLPVTNRLR